MRVNVKLLPVHRSLLGFYFSSDFYHIWNVDPFCLEKELVLSVTQPEVIYAHARN